MRATTNRNAYFAISLVGLAIGAKHAMGLLGLGELELPFFAELDRPLAPWLCAAANDRAHRALAVMRKSVLPSVVVSATTPHARPSYSIRLPCLADARMLFIHPGRRDVSY